MAKFRQIQTSFWSNTYIQEEMTAEDKYFYLYLMTNEFTTQIGIYSITKKQMAFDLGYSIESVSALLQRFETYHKLIKYDVDSRELILLKWAENNLNIGGKPVQDLIKKEIEQVKNKEFLTLMYSSCPENSLKNFIELLIYKNNDSYNDSVNESSDGSLINLSNFKKNKKTNNLNNFYASSDASFNDTGAINNKEEIINNNHDHNNINNNIYDDLKKIKQWFKENKIDFSKKHEDKIIELLKNNSIDYLLNLFQEQIDILKNKKDVKNIAAVFSNHLFKGTTEVNTKEIEMREAEQEKIKNEQRKEYKGNDKAMEVFKSLSTEQQLKIEDEIIEEFKNPALREIKKNTEVVFYLMISQKIKEKITELGLLSA
jgi:hypothetical protein